ncbi:MAG: DNA polymerase III subunit delta' [Rhodospirillaceae bacterium]
MTLPVPREASDLFGHHEAERVLLAAWNSGRLPHAWLFGGISGIGKATLAYRFARFVLSRPRPDAESTLDLFGAPPPVSDLYLSPEHPVFHRVRAGAHPDLLTIERRFDEKRGRMKGEIPVDEVRAVAGFFRRTSGEGGWRVVVIDGVDRMNASGHNALLKILEEPPRQALLLLVTEAPGGLLPTIRSRCRKLPLSPLPEPAVLELLNRARSDLPEADRAALARMAEGSIGRALNLAEADGLSLCRRLIALLATLPRLDLKAAHAFAESIARKGDDTVYETASELFVWWLARLVRTLAAGTPIVEIVPGEAALMGRLAAGGLDRWLEVWEKVGQLFARADSANLERKQVVLNALLCIEAAIS